MDLSEWIQQWIPPTESEKQDVTISATELVVWRLEAAALAARVAGLRRIAEDCGEGTAHEVGCPMAERCVPATAPCLAVTAARGSDEWDEAMENVCKWREDTEREHAGRCWADVWEHEQGLPWPTPEEARP